MQARLNLKRYFAPFPVAEASSAHADKEKTDHECHSVAIRSAS